MTNMENDGSSSQLRMRMALNAQIVATGHELRRDTPAVKAKTKNIANTSVTEWNLGGSSGPGQTFQEHWPTHLPRPPSMKKLVDDDLEKDKASNVPRVIVFNANTQEGSSMVRVLSEKGLKVNAVVRVFTSKNAKQLTKLKGVTVKVADLNNIEAVKLAAESCQQAFLVTKYWERFENPIEETMAKVRVLSRVGLSRDSCPHKSRLHRSNTVPSCICPLVRRWCWMHRRKLGSSVWSWLPLRTRRS
jgi:DNA-directed RNA polymerase subunit N (RpoN/RPB10)